MKLAQEVIEHLSATSQDNIRNPLTFVGGFLVRARKKTKSKVIELSTNIVDDMIKAIHRAELAINKEK